MTDPWDVTIDSDGTTLVIKVRGVVHSCPACGEKICPVCGRALVHGTIPCPDGKPGCLVAHYGWRCACGFALDGRPAENRREE
jgi:hypothetical protein